LEPGTIYKSDLHQKLAQGAVVVTGNSRLAAALHQEFQQQAIDDGLQAWQTP